MAHICQKFILDLAGMFEFRVRPVKLGGAFGDAMLKLKLGALQVFKQLGIIDRDGSLPGQCLQKFQPLGVAFQMGTMIDFEHTLHLPLDDQWRAIVFHK